MLAESLRHLLSINNGKVQLDQLPELFRQTFGHLPIIMDDTKIQEWIASNNILSVASQVVHLNNNRWLVWAPGAYQYPARGIRQAYSSSPLMVGPSQQVTTVFTINDNPHILHGHASISSGSISGTDSTRLTASSPPSPAKRLSSGGTKRKNMAIKFPSASMIKKKEDIPPLIESSNDET